MGGPADKSAHDALHELHTKVATHTLTELCGAKIARPRGFAVRRKRAHMVCDAIFYSQTIILPRQARDKHRERALKKRDGGAFSYRCSLQTAGCLKSASFGSAVLVLFQELLLPLAATPPT
jgi:hypothetical protein